MNHSRRVVRQAGPPADSPKPAPPGLPARRESGDEQPTGESVGASPSAAPESSVRDSRASENPALRDRTPESAARKRNRRGRRRRGGLGGAAQSQSQANAANASNGSAAGVSASGVSAAGVSAAGVSAAGLPASRVSAAGTAASGPGAVPSAPAIDAGGSRSPGGSALASGNTSQPKRRRRRRRGGAPKLPSRPVVFVGPMAAGKTSLGRRVAKELGLQFVDSDVLFVRQHGPIAEFFTANGEPEFRRIEAEIIAAELATEGTRILALGGGAVLSAETRALLANHPTILLMTTQEAVLRTANVSRRPLLRDDPNSWGRILEARRPLYNEVADVTFRTDRAGKEQLTRRVVEWVHSYGRREHQQLAQQQGQQQGQQPPKAAERAPEETLNEQE